MAKKEANFDLYIHGLLKDAGIEATAQGSGVFEINKALKTATKKRTGKAAGYPEFTAHKEQGYWDEFISLEYRPCIYPIKLLQLKHE